MCVCYVERWFVPQSRDRWGDGGETVEAVDLLGSNVAGLYWGVQCEDDNTFFWGVRCEEETTRLVLEGQKGTRCADRAYTVPMRLASKEAELHPSVHGTARRRLHIV